MPLQYSFGAWLRQKRKALDLTREALADRVGCSAATIRKIEAEERRPSAQIVERLALIFDIPSKERDGFLRFARRVGPYASEEPKEFAPWQGSSAGHLSNIPASITSLIGREQEIALVRAYLSTADIRLVTLIGPPGIGKTRLALEVGRTVFSVFPDGVIFVPLAPLDDASLILPTISKTLGYVESKNASQQLAEGIGRKHMLLLLDNCEHLVEAISLPVLELLTACPNLKILVTSREALRVPGEWLFPVPGLQVPGENASIRIETAAKFPALILFAERAHATRSDFNLDAGNIQAVSAICAQLDGLPLAIELIAVQMRLMSPQALLERLTNTFILSAGELRAMSARQKTLGNAIGWSYHQLTPQEQKVFAWLAVFNNGFTLKTAEAVLADTVVEKPISTLIASLADKSLLQSEFDAYGEIRFSMLVVIKMFALDCLRRAGDEACARNHHLAYFLELAEQGAREMRGPNQVEWINRLENELDNIRAALEWSLSSHRTEAALRLLGALGWPWEVRGHYREARNWLEKIRSLPDFERFPASYTRLLNHIGRHSWTQGNFRDGRALLEESRAIALKLETQGEQILAETLNWLGAIALFFEKDIDKAASLFQDGLTLSQKWSDPGGVALSTFHLGIVESDRNHPETALFLLEQSLAKFQQLGDMFFVSRAAAFIGSLYLRQGRYDQARLFFEMHLKIDQEMQFWDGISDGFLDLGNLYRHKGEYDQASYLFEQSLAVCTEHGLYPYNAYYASAMLALVCSNYELAHERFMQLLRLTCHSEEKGGLDVALIGLAVAAVGMKQPERAARLDGAARAIFEITYLSRMEREAYDAHILIAREQLGNDAYAALRAEGRAMSMEQIIQYALGNNKGNPVLNELKSF